MLPQYHMSKSLQFSMQRRMQVILSNVANAHTVGYKRKDLELENLFPRDMETVVEKYHKRSKDKWELWDKQTDMMEYGTGTRISQVYRQFNDGAMEVTNRPYDLAIENGKGMFHYRMPNGQSAYSRAGNLKMDSEGFLVDPNGHPLEPAIRIPVNASEVMINPEGQVLTKLDNDREFRQIGQITLVKFKKPDELTEIGQNLFAETPLSGEPEFMPPGEEGIGHIRQGSLEYSNVNIMESMIEMLITTRLFQVIGGAMDASAKIIKYGANIKG